RAANTKCSSPPTSPRAGSTSRASATSSTTTCRSIPKITFTALAARDAPQIPAMPSPFSPRRKSMPSAKSSATSAPKCRAKNSNARAALQRAVVADRAAQCREARFERIEHRADRDGTRHVQVHFALHACEIAQVIRQDDADHGANLQRRTLNVQHSETEYRR